MEEVTEKCGQAVSKATAVIEETKVHADEELLRIRHASTTRPGDPHPWRSGAPGTFGFPAAGGDAPGYGVSFRPFIAYDANLLTLHSLDKRRAWWDKF
ncbi:LOW QUALITY PROTEIN: hypothetical protein PHMEG_0004539 [Phytophthora megakarya]|uniref:Uncharacterized protein n=1 Tax=Phytophthora megakarya TaxID=4795 RepID=A0A225WTL8_9STRA|nr:LOW QUALITY PROTEIN: hypothetical protein PHMEG_0004539 [Phytophthora megakarya]